MSAVLGTPRVADGPALMAGLSDGPGHAAHVRRFGDLPVLDAGALLAVVAATGLRGRGGAGFPFAVKLRTALESGRRRVLVVNWSEGEPASWKDTALALHRPHLVLDGAAAAARAMGVREVHVVVNGRPGMEEAVHRAVSERPERVAFRVRRAEDRFVAGQARAVLELLAGRPGLPVTAWAPEAVEGHRGRPTLLSNAETWAHVGLLVRGQDSPTTLLTLDGETAEPRVLEVATGTPWRQVVGGGPHLIGGYHGSWVDDRLLRLRVDREEMRAAGVPLGAGTVLRPGRRDCPVAMTARITAYLAEQSAGRCGPCFNGLPALAAEVAALEAGTDTRHRLAQLSGLVTGRGACAHPDGTARLVASLLRELPAEVAAHADGACAEATRVVA